MIQHTLAGSEPVCGGLAAQNHGDQFHPIPLGGGRKAKAGFGKSGEGGFDGAITGLMMQTYCVICGFEKKLNRNGQEYGWPVAVYSTAEQRFGREPVRSCYHMSKEDALAKIMEQMHLLYPDAAEKDILKEI